MGTLYANILGLSMDSGKPMTSKGFCYETLVLTLERVTNKKADRQKQTRDVVRGGVIRSPATKNTSPLDVFMHTKCGSLPI